MGYGTPAPATSMGISLNAAFSVASSGSSSGGGGGAFWQPWMMRRREEICLVPTTRSRRPWLLLMRSSHVGAMRWRTVTWLLCLARFSQKSGKAVREALPVLIREGCRTLGPASCAAHLLLLMAYEHHRVNGERVVHVTAYADGAGPAAKDDVREGQCPASPPRRRG